MYYYKKYAEYYAYYTYSSTTRRVLSSYAYSSSRGVVYICYSHVQHSYSRLVSKYAYRKRLASCHILFRPPSSRRIRYVSGCLYLSQGDGRALLLLTISESYSDGSLIFVICLSPPPGWRTHPRRARRPALLRTRPPSQTRCPAGW